MKGLLLDSSTVGLAVGLAEDGRLLDEIAYEANQRQSEFMVQEVKNLLDRNHIDPKSLGYVVVSKGPGSYTGVRIAMTIAKTIVFALNVPLYLVSSLEMLKVGDEPSICISNARSKRSYVGVYQGDKTVLADTIMDNPKLMDYIKAHPDYRVSGDVSYLGLEGEKVDILASMAKVNVERNLSEPLGAKPVYLKDSTSSASMKIIVRPYISADLSQIMEIEREAFPVGAYTEEQFKSALQNNPFDHLLVAVVDSLVVGFCDFVKTFDSAEINQIAVKKEYRQHGVGTRLMGETVKFCREGEEKADFLCLEVRTDNLIAQRFYRRHGFENVGTKKAFYSDGTDAYYLVRSIIND